MPSRTTYRLVLGIGNFNLTQLDACDTRMFAFFFIPNAKPKMRTHEMAKSSRLFDIIVLAGLTVNIILAVFLILYYFDFL